MYAFKIPKGQDSTFEREAAGGDGVGVWVRRKEVCVFIKQPEAA